MSDLIRIFPKVQPNKTRPRDRASDIADALVAMTFRHIIANWDERSDTFDIDTLRRKLASVLRAEFGGRAR